MTPAGSLLPPAKQVVAQSPVHGFGVFARAAIAAGETIEECPCLVLEPGWEKYTTVLNCYLFAWPKEGDGRAMVFGFGSIYNHAAPANVDWRFDVEKRVATFFATRDIVPGEELFIDYSWEYWDVHDRYTGGGSHSSTTS